MDQLVQQELLFLCQQTGESLENLASLIDPLLDFQIFDAWRGAASSGIPRLVTFFLPRTHLLVPGDLLFDQLPLFILTLVLHIFHQLDSCVVI